MWNLMSNLIYMDGPGEPPNYSGGADAEPGDEPGGHAATGGES